MGQLVTVKFETLFASQSEARLMLFHGKSSDEKSRDSVCLKPTIEHTLNCNLTAMVMD